MYEVKGMLKPKPNQQQLRIQQKLIIEEKNVQRSIKEATKRNDIGTAQAFAKEILMLKKAVNCL